MLFDLSYAKTKLRIAGQAERTERQRRRLAVPGVLRLALCSSSLAMPYTRPCSSSTGFGSVNSVTVDGDDRIGHERDGRAPERRRLVGTEVHPAPLVGVVGGRGAERAGQQAPEACRTASSASRTCR